MSGLSNEPSNGIKGLQEIEALKATVDRAMLIALSAATDPTTPADTLRSVHADYFKAKAAFDEAKLSRNPSSGLSASIKSRIVSNGALRTAIFVGALLFILLFVFATPKKYRFANLMSEGGVHTCICPIYSTPSERGYVFVLIGFETSILLGELLGSVAVGFFVWAIASDICRRETLGVKESLPSTDHPPSGEMNQPLALHSSNSVLTDEPLEKQGEDFDASPIVKMGVMTALPDCDQFPNATGPFGECITNPIPVNGHNGTFVYLSRLRSKSGVGFMWHRLGSEETPPYPKPIDIYELVAIDASEWRKLYFGIYHHRRSTMAPDGLTLLPWSQMKDIERVMAKTGFPGHNQKVENFPFGLPAIIEKSEMLNKIMPDLGKTMAKTAQKWINEHKGKWGASYMSKV